MRLVLARSSDKRSKVSNRIRLGNTENCTGRNTWIAVNSTSMDAVILTVSNRSRMKLGKGTSITKTMETAAMGAIQSPDLRRSAIRRGIIASPPQPQQVAHFQSSARKRSLSPEPLRPYVLRLQRGRQE